MCSRDAKAELQQYQIWIDEVWVSNCNISRNYSPEPGNVACLLGSRPSAFQRRILLWLWCRGDIFHPLDDLRWSWLGHVCLYLQLLCVSSVVVYTSVCANGVCRYFAGWFRGDGRRYSIHHILDFMLASSGVILYILHTLGWLTPGIGVTIGTVGVGDETDRATLEYPTGHVWARLSVMASRLLISLWQLFQKHRFGDAAHISPKALQSNCRGHGLLLPTSLEILSPPRFCIWWWCRKQKRKGFIPCWRGRRRHWTLTRKQRIRRWLRALACSRRCGLCPWRALVICRSNHACNKLVEIEVPSQNIIRSLTAIYSSSNSPSSHLQSNSTRNVATFFPSFSNILAFEGVKGSPAVATLRGSLNITFPSSTSTIIPQVLNWSNTDTGNGVNPGSKTTVSSGMFPATANSGSSMLLKYLDGNNRTSKNTNVVRTDWRSSYSTTSSWGRLVKRIPTFPSNNYIKHNRLEHNTCGDKKTSALSHTLLTLRKLSLYSSSGLRPKATWATVFFPMKILLSFHWKRISLILEDRMFPMSNKYIRSYSSIASRKVSINFDLRDFPLDDVFVKLTAEIK